MYRLYNREKDQINKCIVIRILLFSNTNRFRDPLSFNGKMCRSKCDLVIYMRSSFASVSDNCTRPLLRPTDASSIGTFGLFYIILYYEFYIVSRIAKCSPCFTTW